MSTYLKQLEHAIVQSDIIALFDNLLTYAVEEGASDIHIEPYENISRIRIRVDGVLEQVLQFPHNMHDNVVSKFKIESGQMRSDEKRLPQDARVSTMTLTNKEIDLRASTLPTVRGEKLVMRIVDKSKQIPQLETLGIEGSNEKIIYQQLKKPNGVILTTGPTGSGKTSTLYACLQHIKRPEINIMTYEDPVENKIPGLAQSQVRADIGYTFAAGLRAGLRQDPDVIMVGEIRDAETLEMAMESAMTGHLVFSTVHTNSAAETITRVLNLGAAPYMIAGTFNLVMAQRLVRRNCTHCQRDQQLDAETHQHVRAAFAHFDQEKLKQELLSRSITQEQWNRIIADATISVGSGQAADGTTCPHCDGTGFKGRIGLFELMDYTDDIREMLIQGKTAFEIEKYALQQGMINLERDGLFKVMKGLIPVSEVYRVVTHSG